MKLPSYLSEIINRSVPKALSGALAVYQFMSVVTLGSNISSIKAQRKLGKVSSEVSSIFERLSSGQRINKASDDAAGLSIASTLGLDKRVFQQGLRNLNDGISLTSIADGAIEQLSTIVIRLKELAEQASNGTFGDKQRKALDSEAQALSKEFTRIARSTKFNGRGVFYSEFGQLRLQSGYGIDGGVQSGLGGEIGTGTFAMSNFGSSNTTKGTSGDFNGDGIDDLFMSLQGATSQILLGTGGGGFQTATNVMSGFTDMGSVVTGDFNGDGILDIAAQDYTANALTVSIGRGDGTFLSATTYSTGVQDGALTVGDFNGDGFQDIAESSVGDNNIGIYLSNGNGTFQSRQTIAAGATSNDIITADFTGDGILDLAVANGGVSKIQVFRGTGNGSFTAIASYTLTAFTAALAAGDVNGDGSIDLVTALSDGRISVTLNQGNGTFGTGVTYSVGSDQVAIEIADFNGDGNLDVATGSFFGSRVHTIFGAGDGTFGGVVSYSLGQRVRDLTLIDADQDGVQDFVSFRDSGVTILTQNSTDGVAPLLAFNLASQVGARQALPKLDQALQRLSTQRGTIGAFQSRMAVAYNVLQASADNYAAAEGRIRDVDVADETASLTRLTILRQAASAVLAQANQQPEIALRLLE